jgi:hypothetical protein
MNGLLSLGLFLFVSSVRDYLEAYLQMKSGLLLMA